MEIVVLESGSKGNCTYIGTEKTGILIDTGLSLAKVKRHLQSSEIELSKINGVLITHEHNDHIKGILNFIKMEHIDLYMTEETYRAIADKIGTRFKYKKIIKNSLNVIGDIAVTPLPLSHDAVDPIGLIIEFNYKRIVYITDTGYLNMNYYDILKGASCYIFESNHDVEKLMSGSYPFYLKQRILSDKGHLSNVDSANHLANLISEQTTHVVLAHISEKNNDYDIVYEEFINVMKSKKVRYEDKEIIIASQQGPTSKISI